MVYRSLIAFFFSLFCSHGVFGGTIILSGDSNIGNPIDGSAGTSINNGNRRFFQNVLGLGTRVRVHNEVFAGPSGLLAMEAMNNFYNTLPGVSSVYDAAGTVLTDSLLAGLDLLIIRPNDGFGSNELFALQNFLAGSRTVMFVGENNNFTATNALLSADILRLGGSMQLGQVSSGAGFSSTNDILMTPFTPGVTSISYAASNSVSGGIPVARTTATTGAFPFIAYETLRPFVVPETSSCVIWIAGVVSTTILSTCRRKRNRKGGGAQRCGV